MVETATRALPWAGEGNTFARQLLRTGSALGAIQGAGLEWEVHLEPVFLQDDTRVTRHRAVVRSDNGYPLGVVGRRYVPIQNREMLQFVDEFRKHMKPKVEPIAAGEIDKGRRVYAVLELPVARAVRGTGFHQTRFFVVMVNAHDGKSAFRIGLVPIRIWCTNQLRLWMLGHPPMSWSIRHTRAFGLLIEDLKKTIGRIPDYLRHFSDLRDRLVAEKLSDKAFEALLERLIVIPPKASKRTANNRRRYRQGIRAAYDDKANRDLRGSRWGAVNAVAAWEQWSKPARIPKSVNRTTWQLTSLVNERGNEYVNRALVMLAA